jgi:energy-converting hydrogenase B subunit K
MPIQSIDPYLCSGCGLCINICPEDVIRKEGDVAAIVYPEDCLACLACEAVCPLSCIQVSIERAYELAYPY